MSHSSSLREMSDLGFEKKALVAEYIYSAFEIMNKYSEKEHPTVAEAMYNAKCKRSTVYYTVKQMSDVCYIEKGIIFHVGEK